jgi:hypothetical protein
MSGRRGARPIIERLVPAAFTGENHSPAMSAFLRGVTTGALVGAALAGSALWTRYRRQRPEAIGREAPADASSAAVLDGVERPQSPG